MTKAPISPSEQSMTTQDPGTPAFPPALPPWRIVLDDQWEALRRKVLAVDPATPRNLARITGECRTLIGVTAWFKAHGNLTEAALSLGTSRKTLRIRIAAWRRDHPHLVPTPVPIDRSPKAKRRALKDEVLSS